jgi:hypothetical protein
LAEGGSPWKGAVRVVSTANITLSGLQTIDGVVLEEGDRVLVAGQTDAKRNGIWTARTGAWTRAIDMARSLFLRPGSATLVLEGTTYEMTLWVLEAPTTGTLTIDSTSLTFTHWSPPVSGDIAVDSIAADEATIDVIEANAIANSDGVLAITGGTGITLNMGGLLLTIDASGNVARIVGAASAGLLLSTGAGAATINGATGVALQHGGAAAWTADLATNVSRFVGAGSSGTLVQSTNASLTLNAPTSVVIQRAGTPYVTVDASGLTATGLISPTLQHGGNIGILAPSYIYARSAGGVFLDGPVDFRDATGATTRARINGTGAITLPVIAAGSVATPAAGEKTIFFDASNSDKFSSKNSSGTVTVIGTET